jgi:hypothetical protein
MFALPINLLVMVTYLATLFISGQVEASSMPDGSKRAYVLVQVS